VKESKPAYTVQTLEQAEAVHVAYVLELYDWNQTKAATALAINRRTLSRMIERHRLERKGKDPGALSEFDGVPVLLVECPSCSSELDDPLAITCTECGHTLPKPGDPNAPEHASD
jgi:hypothetical protein